MNTTQVTTKDGRDDHHPGHDEERRPCHRIGGLEDDDDDSWELLDENLNRKPAVVDLVTLEKQQREAFQNGPSPTSGRDFLKRLSP